MAPFRFSEWTRRGEAITLYGGGGQTRDFTYIDDIARGILAALKPLGYEIINLGGGNTPLAVNDMIHALEIHLGRKTVIDRQPAIAADMRDSSAEIAKANRLLDWRPTTPPDEGVRLTAEWHVANSAWLGSIEL